MSNIPRSAEAGASIPPQTSTPRSPSAEPVKTVRVRLEPEPADLPPLRKAAILVVSLEQPLASKLLAQLDRATVEAVTLEIARLDRIDPAEQEKVLEEFFGLGVSRMRFVFDDLARLEPEDLRLAYHADDLRLWALALAGSDSSVQGFVSTALEPADAQALRVTMASMGPFRLGEAETAQAELTELLRRMHDQGRITLPAPPERDWILV